MMVHQKEADTSWQSWVRSAFEKGDGAAHRASKAKALEAAVAHTDNSQPYQLADRELECWSELWSCHEVVSNKKPADSQSWDLLPKLRPEDLPENVGRSRATASSRFFWYLSQPGLVALAALFAMCEHTLMWPSDRLVNEMV
eukprot:8023714-Pyramimonas_sp.AAC.1